MRPSALVLPVLAAAVLLHDPRPARADEYSHGFYAELGLGAHTFLGQTGQYAAVGPSFGIRSGYDLFSWLSLGAYLAGSTHEATVPPPPDREYFQLYTGAAEGRITVRVWRLALFAEGTLGAAAVSTNVLDRVAVTEPDSHLTMVFGGGGGLDYHIQNRHFSIGLACDYALYPSFDASSALNVRLYLRYAK